MFQVVTSGVSPLHAAAFGGPVGEPLQLVAVFPYQLNKFRCGQVRRFFSQKRFKPPLQVGAIPRPQPVTPSRNPVKLKCLPHRSCLSYRNAIRRAGRTDVHAPTPRFSPFFPRFPYTAPVYRSSCHPSFLPRSASARWSRQCFRAESLLILFRPLASRSASDPAILCAHPRHTASSRCKKTAPDHKRPGHHLSRNISPRCLDRPCSTPRNIRQSICETSHRRWLSVVPAHPQTSASRRKKQSARTKSSDSPA